MTPTTLEPLTRTQAMVTARRMWNAGEGSWTIGEIRAYLTRRGQTVSWATVRAWVDPAYAEERRARDRVAQRQRYRQRHGVRPEALKVITEVELLERMRQLKGAELSDAAIAKVMRLDYGQELTKLQVFYALRNGRYPKLTTPREAVK